jgi:hypothetical protein
MYCDIFVGPRGPFTVDQLERATARFVQAVHYATDAINCPDDKIVQETFDNWCDDWHRGGSMAEQFYLGENTTTEEIEAWASQNMALFLKVWAGKFDRCACHRELWQENRVVLVLGGDDGDDPSDHPAWHAALLLQSCRALNELGIT